MKCIQDHVETETAMARKRVQDAKTAIIQEREDMITGENAGAMIRKPKKTFEEMLHAIRDSLSDLASSDDEQDVEDEEDDQHDTEFSKLSDDDEPGWMMGTISKTVQHHEKSFRQMQMRFDTLTQPGWGDAANFIHERDQKYGTAKLSVPAVVKPQMDMTATTPSLAAFGVLMQTLDMVPGNSQMPGETSRRGSSQVGLGLEKPQSHNLAPILSSDMAPNSTPIKDAKHVEPVSIYPCI